MPSSDASSAAPSTTASVPSYCSLSRSFELTLSLQSPRCQNAHWPLHKSICDPLSSLRASRAKTPPTYIPEDVPAVDLLGGDEHPFNPREIVLSLDRCEGMMPGGVLCPISRMIGVPLVIFRHFQHRSADTRFDNQAVTYLMLDPEHGYTPHQ